MNWRYESMNTNKTLLTAEILRDWFFIDSVLLNDHAKKAIIESKDYEEYISLKAALLSDLYEFYNHIGYSPKDKIPKNHIQVQENALLVAKKSKKVSASMIERADFKKYLKNKIVAEFNKNPKQDVNTLSDKVINERFLRMAMDNILIGVPVIECKNQSKAGDFKGSILEQAYLTVRNDMISIASKYNSVLKKNL